MPTTTLHLAHAELCSDCTDLLPVGSTIVVDDERRVLCLSCAPEELAPVVGFTRNDPWTWISNLDLHDRLVRRLPGMPHRRSALTA